MGDGHDPAAVLRGIMNTSDIIESMNMAATSTRPLPAILMHEIADALKERDELRAAVAWESGRVDQLHLAAANDEADKATLRQELANLSKELAEQSIPLLVFNEVCQELDAAREALANAENERDAAIIERDQFREENRRIINKYVQTPIVTDG